MTRLLILLDKATFAVHDSLLTSEELAEAIICGKAQLPILEQKQWCVFQIDDNVIAVPAYHLLPEDKRLSSRHVDILNDLLSGFSTRQIAARRGIQVVTVRQYIRDLEEYFGVENREQIVLRAIQHRTTPTGEIQPD